MVAQPTASSNALTWSRAKDGIVLSLGALLVGMLGFLLKGQNELAMAMSEVKRDIAVLASQTERDREELTDVQSRIRDLEIRKVANHG